MIRVMKMLSRIKMGLGPVSAEMIVSADCYHLLMKQQVLVKVTVFDLIDQVPFSDVGKRYLKMMIIHEALEHASFQLLTKSQN